MIRYMLAGFSLVLLLSGAVQGQVPQEVKFVERVWTTRVGAEFRGVFQHREVNTIFIRGADERLFSVPYAELSQADRAYLLTFNPDDLSYLNPSSHIRSIKKSFGERLTTREGVDVPPEVLDGRLVCLFFGAKRSRESRKYIKKFQVLEKSLMDISDRLAIIYISMDRSEERMQEGLDEQEVNWLVMPYEAIQRGQLVGKFQVKKTPQLVFVSPFGQEVGREGLQVLDAPVEEGVKAFKDFIEEFVEQGK